MNSFRVYESIISLHHWEVMKHSQRSLFTSQIILSFSYTQRNVFKKIRPNCEVSAHIWSSFRRPFKVTWISGIKHFLGRQIGIIQHPFVPTDPFYHFTALNSKYFLIAQHFLIQMIGAKGQGSKMTSGQMVKIWTNYYSWTWIFGVNHVFKSRAF